MLFIDRTDAGLQLARRLMHLRDEHPVVIGIPRGGVPVASMVAQALAAPLDVVVVRKLRVPYQPELAMGAVGEGGVRVLSEQVIRRAGITRQELARVEDHELAEVAARAKQFRGDRQPVSLSDRTVILVDDGIATGSTMRAACRIVRAGGAKRVIVAVPVAPPDTVDHMRRDADEVVCLHTPDSFFGVGQFYDDFTQISDAQVTGLVDGAANALAANETRTTPTQEVADPPLRDEEVTVRTTASRLAGQLTVPERAPGLVLFAHGSGSSRHSPRNRYVARLLNQASLATLLFDLLTPEEELDRANVFNVDKLAGRLTEVTGWAAEQPDLQHLSIGYFGASTGAAAALAAAAAHETDVAAVVSRGGRPELVGNRLFLVEAPTLLIVGSRDPDVLELNRHAQRRLHCPNRLAVVPGATHLFEEPGTLQSAAELSREWFLTYLVRTRQPHPLA